RLWSLALKLESITRGASGISMSNPVPPAWFPGNQDTLLYGLCLAGVALCVLIAMRLTHGDTGRSLRAVRDNPLIAESLGVNLTKVSLPTFSTTSDNTSYILGRIATMKGALPLNPRLLI